MRPDPPISTLAPPPTTKPTSPDAPTYSPAQRALRQAGGWREHAPGQHASRAHADIYADGVDGAVIVLRRRRRQARRIGALHRLVADEDKPDVRIDFAFKRTDLRPRLLTLGGAGRENITISASVASNDSERCIIFGSLLPNRKEYYGPIARCTSANACSHAVLSPAASAVRARAMPWPTASTVCGKRRGADDACSERVAWSNGPAAPQG